MTRNISKIVDMDFAELEQRILAHRTAPDGDNPVASLQQQLVEQGLTVTGRRPSVPEYQFIRPTRQS